MLSSIHPFGERSRNNTFRRTAAAHVIGSTLGGMVLGSIFGSVGWLIVQLVDVSSQMRNVVIAVAALAALLIEATSHERLLPTRSRQVNENWIQNYRGWVYGGGFGAELGFGISTIITTPLIYLLVISMLLVGSIGAGVTLGAVFGFMRGSTVLAARHIDSPEALRKFHQRLDEQRSRSRSWAVASLAFASTIGLAGVFT